MAEMITGDLTRQEAYNTKASAVPFTAVAAADLAVATHPLNRTQFSGKKAGYGFLVLGTDGRYSLFVATGSEPTDAWQKIGGAADGTEDVTPA